ncbi:hypothetical protein [Lentzea sp. NPDC059081]|uniref:hypothetical protein n=1 Tax=Lentzea sp. NPDC059081 TaxID=3346719 RepID=UPI0036CFEF42
MRETIDLARINLAGAIATTLVVLSGCSDASEEPLGQIVDLDRVTYPLASFDLNEAELETVLQARYMLTRRCTSAQGAVLPQRQHGRNRPSRQDQYGMYDEKTARGWAYSLDGPRATVAEWEEGIDRHSPLFGIAIACRDLADRTLGWAKTSASERDPLPALESKAWNSSKADPSVRRAAADWQRCMARRGHHLDDDPALAPYSYWTSQRMAAHPNLTPEQRKRGIPPTDAERRAALDDIRCKNQSGFVRTWVDADVSAQQRLVVDNRTRLDGHRRALDEVVRNAAFVVT